MVILLIAKLRDFFLSLKQQFYFVENFIEKLAVILLPPRRKYALPILLSVMNFDSKSQIEDEYLTVSQMAQRFPAFSQGSIRWLIFNMETNGFSKVVVKIGRKVVLKLSAFKQFLEDQTQK